MDKKFIELNTETEYTDTALSFRQSMFKVSEFIKEVKQALQKSGLSNLVNNLSQKGGIPGTYEQWYMQGVDCEILKPGTKGWKKGKLRIKISLEFSSDEPDIEEVSTNHNANANQLESPLDDIRRTMNQNS